MSLNTLFEELHTLTVQELLTRIKTGEATSADLSVARSLLKDNQILISIEPDSPLADMEDILTEYDPEVL